MLPKVTVSFSAAASSAIARSQKGTVAMLLKDTAAGGLHVLTKATQTPATLSAANKLYISLAFLGYVSPPKKVIVYVLTGEKTLADGLAEMAKQEFDYLVGPPDTSAADAAAIAAWIIARRAEGAVYKAVLPDYVADNEAIVNVTSDGMTDGTTTYTTAGYCARIAGLIAGTPMTISCTYAPLPELSDLTRLDKAAMDAAVDAGQLILLHDGVKVKVARGVNSLTTLTAAKSAVWKKIKIVETLDMIQHDIRLTCQDSYIGKYANSYDNKLVLCTAIKAYLVSLEQSGILQAGASTVDIDTDANETYLQSKGVDTSAMSEQALREADTADQVFLRATISPLDAIEDITLAVTV